MKLSESMPLRCASALAVGCLAASVTADTLPAAPSAAVLLARVVERAKGERERDAAFKARYAFTRDRLLEVRDGSGELKQRDPKRIEHTPSPPATNQWSNTAGGEPPENRAGWKPRAYDRQDFQLDRDLLAHFHFEPPRGEILDDRAVWRLDFQSAAEGRAGARIKERFLIRLAGRAWVDAAEDELVRLEVRLTAPVQVFGGLVGTVKDCRVLIERERTADGCWYTRRLKWHLEGRQFFSARIMDFTEEIRDVQRSRG